MAWFRPRNVSGWCGERGCRGRDDQPDNQWRTSRRADDGQLIWWCPERGIEREVLVAERLGLDVRGGVTHRVLLRGMMLSVVQGRARVHSEMPQLHSRLCATGSKQQCDVLRGGELPPYVEPVPMLVPGWSSAFPVAAGIADSGRGGGG